MLKISQTGKTGREIILRLEGRVIGPWVAELRDSCEKVLRDGQPLTLNLADVEFLDADGVALVSGYGRRGIPILNCTPFVAEQLKRWQ